MVAEILFGEVLAFKRACTGVACAAEDGEAIACCPLGNAILVLAGKARPKPVSSEDSMVQSRSRLDERHGLQFSQTSVLSAGSQVQAPCQISAVLVRVDEGELSESAIHASELAVGEGPEWSSEPYLCPLSESRALLSFAFRRSLWYCDVVDGGLKLARLSLKTPTRWGFCSLPTLLPSGELLAAGSFPRSTDITVLSLGDQPSFRKLGDAPGVARRSGSTILLKGRFVLGFGGSGSQDDLWIFDLQNQAASIVWERGEWHPGGQEVFMACQDGVLYLIGGSFPAPASAISLDALPELIHDDGLRKAFCSALSLPQASLWSPDEELLASPGMRKLIGNVSLRNSNTVSCGGRVFSFSHTRGELLISEILLGQRVKRLDVSAGLNCKTDNEGLIACCPLGDGILVMAGAVDATDLFAALVVVDKGELKRETVHITKLDVHGNGKWLDTPFLVQVAKKKAWLSFRGSDEVWFCQLRGGALAVEKSSHALPTRKGFGTVPTGLPEGWLLAAGADPATTDVTLFSTQGKFVCEVIGEIPGEARRGVSTVALGDRFVIGFGGWNSGDRFDDVWVLDLQTCGMSAVGKAGEWHPPTSRAFLVVDQGTLYILGGVECSVAHCISLSALAGQIQNEEIRIAFKQWLCPSEVEDKGLLARVWGSVVRRFSK